MKQKYAIFKKPNTPESKKPNEKNPMNIERKNETTQNLDKYEGNFCNINVIN